jgi:ubiquinol-cytochrome c reductase cytochrome c1 subunit
MISNLLRKDLAYFATALTGSTLGGLAISEYVLTDERLDTLKAKLPQSFGFSTADHGMHVSKYPWEFEKIYRTFDHAALRRGYQVYREVCSACHSMDFIYWRNLVGVTHTEAEVKAMAEEHQYKDGPNDEGEYFMREGKVVCFLY